MHGPPAQWCMRPAQLHSMHRTKARRAPQAATLLVVQRYATRLALPALALWCWCGGVGLALVNRRSPLPCRREWADPALAGGSVPFGAPACA